VAGVIDTIAVVQLRRLIFRGTKGQSYMYIQELEHEEDEDPKSVYIIVFWEGARTREKIENICRSFGESVNLPPLAEIDNKLKEQEKAIEDGKNVFEETRRQLREQLIAFDKIEDDEDRTSSTIYIYKMFMAKEKALYQNLNMMK